MLKICKFNSETYYNLSSSACAIAEKDHIIITGGKIGYFVTKTVFNTVSKYNLYVSM